MRISILGSGYVGLVTGISLATLGHTVSCIDQDRDKIESINAGRSPFFEPGINEHLKKALDGKLLYATDNLQGSVSQSDVTIIAVGTPTVGNKIDLSAIEKASEQAGEAIKKTKKYQVIAVKSTVLPGVTEEIVKPIVEKYSNKKMGEFGLCMNPEFLREGNALEDALNPDRIVIGQYDDKSGENFAKIYADVHTTKIFTNLATAEMTKYAANALLATLISYSNEIARISETVGKIDVVDVWKGVHSDRRLSPYNGDTQIKPGILSYITSGCGFGGSCFPKDTQALMSFAQEQGIEPRLISSVIDINRTQHQRIILLLKGALGQNLQNRKIAVLGLTFKPDTDDMRESPAFPIIQTLIAEGAKVTCHDPKAYKNMARELIALSGIFCNTIEETIEQSDAAILVTAWEDYLKLTPQFFKSRMKQPIVIDGRRMYDKPSFLNAGVIYKGIGLSNTPGNTTKEMRLNYPEHHFIKTGHISNCQVCNSDKLHTILDLGHQPLCDTLLTQEMLNEPEKTYPLRMEWCENCTGVQIDHCVPGEEVYHPDYPYRTGITKELAQYLESMALSLVSKYKLGSQDMVVDVGSNDGTLLKGFKKAGTRTVGVEPTNIAKIANEDGIDTVQSFFDVETAKKVREKYGPASLIVTTNTFAHMQTIGEFVAGAHHLLSDSGTFVSETHYLLDIIRGGQFDTIYHEHLRTYSLRALITLFDQYDFTVTDVERGDRYGGNIRVHVTKGKNKKVDPSVRRLLKEEEKFGLDKLETYTNFARRVRTARIEFMQFLIETRRSGKHIVGNSCPARSSTLLNYYGIDEELIPYLAEQPTSLKLNRYLPGKHIPVVNNQRLIDEQPDFVVILAWHYAKPIMEQLKERGLKSDFIIPLPDFTLVKNSEV